MATFHNTATQWMAFQPVSAAMRNIPNTAGTWAALIRTDASTAACDVAGLLNNSNPYTPDLGVNAWYHTLGIVAGNNDMFDDDGIVGVNETPTWTIANSTWYIIVVAWPAGGSPAIQRFHHVNQQSPAGWTHANSGANNGGNRAGPVTGQGHIRIGYFNDNAQPFDCALVAAWSGVQLSDAQTAELSVNNKTSDWWNNSGGHPDFLVECTTLTPTDIGANPSTFWGTGGSPALTGPNPTWTFDGQGSATGTPDRRMAQRHSRGTSW